MHQPVEPEQPDEGAIYCSCGEGRHRLNGTSYLACPVCDAPDPDSKETTS